MIGIILQVNLGWPFTNFPMGTRTCTFSVGALGWGRGLKLKLSLAENCSIACDSALIGFRTVPQQLSCLHIEIFSHKKTKTCNL